MKRHKALYPSNIAPIDSRSNVKEPPGRIKFTFSFKCMKESRFGEIVRENRSWTCCSRSVGGSKMRRLLCTVPSNRTNLSCKFHLEDLPYRLQCCNQTAPRPPPFSRRPFLPHPPKSNMGERKQSFWELLAISSDGILPRSTMQRNIDIQNSSRCC